MRSRQQVPVTESFSGEAGPSRSTILSSQTNSNTSDLRQYEYQHSHDVPGPSGIFVNQFQHLIEEPGPSGLSITSHLSSSENEINQATTHFKEANPSSSLDRLSSPEASVVEHSSDTLMNQQLSGRRIVDITHFFNEITNFKHIELFECQNQRVKIKKEIRQGFDSIFMLECEMCKANKRISSDPGLDMNLNMSVVLGTIATGGSYAQMEECFSLCNVPVMSKHSFLRIQNELADVIHDIAWEELEKAGKEEKALAIQKGHVDPDGIPYITVIADGAWSKRSYKVNYDALSGVVSK